MIGGQSWNGPRSYNVSRLITCLRDLKSTQREDNIPSLHKSFQVWDMQSWLLFDYFKIC